MIVILQAYFKTRCNLLELNPTMILFENFTYQATF